MPNKTIAHRPAAREPRQPSGHSVNGYSDEVPVHARSPAAASKYLGDQLGESMTKIHAAIMDAARGRRTAFSLGRIVECRKLLRGLEPKLRRLKAEAGSVTGLVPEWKDAGAFEHSIRRLLDECCFALDLTSFADAEAAGLERLLPTTVADSRKTHGKRALPQPWLRTVALNAAPDLAEKKNAAALFATLAIAEQVDAPVLTTRRSAGAEQWANARKTWGRLLDEVRQGGGRKRK
jgi:hypothetical protein